MGNQFQLDSFVGLAKYEHKRIREYTALAKGETEWMLKFHAEQAAYHKGKFEAYLLCARSIKGWGTKAANVNRLAAYRKSKAA